MVRCCDESVLDRVLVGSEDCGYILVQSTFFG